MAIFKRDFQHFRKLGLVFYHKHFKKKMVFTCDDNLLNYNFVGTQREIKRLGKNKTENKLYNFMYDFRYDRLSLLCLMRSVKSKCIIKQS